MVALQYSDVEFKIKFKKFDDLWLSSNGNPPVGEYKISNFQISVEYVYLDTKERKLFAQSNHEYLIKQIQYSLDNNILENRIKEYLTLILITLF